VWARVAGTGDEVLVLAERVEPDVVLMDLHMPGLGGIEATRRIVDAYPSTAVLVVAMFDDDYSMFTAMRAGARGYVLKDADEEEVLRSIRAVGHGV
jgi:DNA-binding NarL/FixJ family response regulator